MIAPPKDGLVASWSGRVWLNPPYGENEQWLSKLVEHGNGIALLASRTEVERWFVPFVWQGADSILFLFGRLFFHLPNGERALGNAGHGSVLAAYGMDATAALIGSGLRGHLVNLR